MYVFIECGDGSGLAVDAAGRWYRDDELVENMVEAVRDDGETVVLTGDDGVSVVSDGNTNIYVRGGSFGDLINVGYHSDYDAEEEIMSVVNDARVDRAFGLVVSQVGGDASVRVMGDYVEPGNPTHVTPSYLGVFLVMLVAHAWGCGNVLMLLGRRNGVSVGRNRGGARTGKRSAPPCVCPRAFISLHAHSRLFICGAAGWWCGWPLLLR